MFDIEKFSIIGKYGIELTEDNKFTTSEPIPETVKNIISGERDLWIEHLKFLKKGDEVPSTHSILKRLELASLETDSDGNTMVEDDYLYQSFLLEWEKGEMKSLPNGADLKKVRGIEGYTGYYAYDKTLTSAERGEHTINIFIVEWSAKRVYKLQSDMASANSECKNILKYVEMLGSLEFAIEWGKAKDTYEIAAQERFKDLFIF